MSDEEVLNRYHQMEEFFNTTLPHPEHEPLRFAYYAKLYTHFNPPNTPPVKQDDV